MSVFAEVPRSVTEKKPPHGTPCNRCGGCCMATLCPLGRHIFKTELGPCPALSFDTDGSRCGMIDEPMKFARIGVLQFGFEAMRAAARLLIGSGLGCDARFNGEIPNQKFYEKMHDWDRRNTGPVNRAKRMWGIK